jgi:hypothetical protein
MPNKISTSVTEEYTILRIVMPCSLAEVHHFLHLQRRKVSEEINRQEASRKQSVLVGQCWLLGLLLIVEEGMSMFLRNDRELLPNYTASHPGR